MTSPRQSDGHLFMAAQSFGPADTELFFGRDEEGIKLARFIEDRSFSVLTAPSGIGKTSLLNARVIPLLEKRGWITVSARPTDDPERSIRNSICDHLAPEPALELAVIERLIQAAPRGEQRSLASAIRWHRELSFKDRVGHRFFLPRQISPFEALPMVSRALRESISGEDLVEHFEALASHGPCLGISEESTLAELRDHLKEAHLRKSNEVWRSRIARPEAKLLDTLSYVEANWLALRPRAAGLLLIIDQFEEMFTVAGPKVTVEWISQFQEVTEAQTEGLLPHAVRLMVSLRKEFLADLMPFLEPFGPAATITFFLGSLSRSQAIEALSCPLQRVGYKFVNAANEDPTIERALAGAETDSPDLSAGENDDASAASDRFSPILISLLGAHLWKGLQADPEPENKIDFARFRRLVPSLENIFHAFLQNALGQLEALPNLASSSFDALELMDRLVTGAGYRNFVLEDQLLSEAPMTRKDAEKLLGELDYTHRLVRRERRGKGMVFVEIMHERLIEPIRMMLAQLRQQDQLRASLLAANDMLKILQDEPDPEAADPLPSYFRASLQKYCDRLDMDALAAKTLLRSLLLAGPDEDDAAWAKAILECAPRVHPRYESESDRRLLLNNQRLSAELLRHEEEAFKMSFDERRLLTRSALADTSDQAAELIQRVAELWKRTAAA